MICDVWECGRWAGGGGGLDDLSVLLLTAPGAATIAPLLYILITHQWDALVIKSFYLEINIAIDIFLESDENDGVSVGQLAWFLYRFGNLESGRKFGIQFDVIEARVQYGFAATSLVDKFERITK